MVMGLSPRVHPLSPDKLPVQALPPVLPTLYSREQTYQISSAPGKPDLIILDLGLPDGDGIEFIRDLRQWSAVPVIVLSARSEESDKIAALDAGADDYLSKPFGIGELQARLRVALRRHSATWHKPIPNTGFSNEMAGASGILFQFLSQMSHINTQIVTVFDRVWPPHLIE